MKPLPATFEFKQLTPVFYAPDLRPILHFYRDLLGFQMDTLYPSEETPEVLVMDRDGISVMYLQTGPMPTSSAQLNIDVEDVDAVLGALPEEIEVEWGPEDFFYNRREFGIRDPNGILIVFSMLLSR